MNCTSAGKLGNGRAARGLYLWTAAVVLIVLLSAIPAGASAAGSMAVQPDGKVLVAGNVWPGFAAIARVNSNGTLDSSFGKDGFLVDRRLASLRSIALQPDGRILAAAENGFGLARYFSDGSFDPGFSAAGAGRTRGPAQAGLSKFVPETILPWDDGGSVVGGWQRMGRSEAPQAIVRRFDPKGAFVETVGEVPQPEGHPTFESVLSGLLAEPDGSLVGTGHTYVSSDAEQGSRILLARFVPGSGTSYDPSFGGGQGLVRIASQNQDAPNFGQAIARQGSALLVAGTSENTFLLARFDAQGRLDQSFAGGTGVAIPPIVGTSGEDGTSWAQAIAVGEDGRALVAGGTTRWGQWGVLPKLLYGCREGCPQPMLARFTAAGQLDPSFGSGGLLRLLSPTGGVLEGEVEQLARLAEGKYLVKGTLTGQESTPFLARLNEDGSYDASFGQGGMAVLAFPCRGSSQAALKREGCLANAIVKLGVSGVAAGRPRLMLKVRPDVPWARIRSVVMTLPKILRPTRHLARRSRVIQTSGKDGHRARVSGPAITKDGKLHFAGRRLPIGLSARLLPGALRSVGKLSKRRTLVFRVSVSFVHNQNYPLVGTPTVVLRRHGS